LSVPLRHGPQRFVGPVVFICDLADGFEIGVELSLADAERAAIVERICELEARLQRDAVAAARHRAAEWATLRPRLERIPSLKALVSAALPPVDPIPLSCAARARDGQRSPRGHRDDAAPGRGRHGERHRALTATCAESRDVPCRAMTSGKPVPGPGRFMDNAGPCFRPDC